MKNKMNIYYKDDYKSWIDKNQIKIGETSNWNNRLKMYEDNYGIRYIHKHKNYPKCDGCLINKDDLNQDHNHLDEIISWKVNLSKQERHAIEGVIRSEFSSYGRTKDYFDKKDLDEIKERLNSILN